MRKNVINFNYFINSKYFQIEFNLKFFNFSTDKHIKGYRIFQLCSLCICLPHFTHNITLSIDIKVTNGVGDVGLNLKYGI